MTLTLYCGHFGGDQSGPGHGLLRDIRVLWTFEETGVDYKVQWFDVTKGETKADTYRGANPFGKIPAVKDEETGFTLFESAAICRYVAEQAGSLLPENPEARAEVDQWVHFANSTLDPVLFGYFATVHFTPDAPGNDFRQERLKASADDMMGTLNELVDGRRFLVGDAFTLADLFLGAVLRYSLGLPTGEGFEAVRQYQEALYGRPAFERALALHMRGQ